MKKLVVYSVLVGRGEAPTEHKAPLSSDYDRVLFTDDPNLKIEGWEVRMLPDHDLGSPRESRRPKLLPHHFFPDHEWSLYVDNNVVITCDPLAFLEARQGGAAFQAFRHPWRDCAYDEAEAVIQQGYDSEPRVREQVDLYRRKGLPAHAGLIVGNVLLRRHHEPQLKAVAERWYEHVLTYSKRDQISFPFVTWSQGLSYGVFDQALLDSKDFQYPARQRADRVKADFDEQVYRWLNPEVEQSGLSAREHFATRPDKAQARFRKHRWTLRHLANKYRSDKGNIYYNAHNYADIYETLFAKRREEPLRILEIGLLRHDVQARNPGGPYDDAPSLAMWRDYFPNATIYGFDVGDFSTVKPMDRVTILRGDMGNKADLQRLLDETGGAFDIIIDDASHASHHQQIALSYLYDSLNPDGLYIIEDLHYQPAALEEEGLPKTRRVLRRLEFGLFRKTKYLSRQKLEAISGSAARVAFYDSQDRNFGRLHSDAFAVIQKKP
jgi:hypothetical protein